MENALYLSRFKGPVWESVLRSWSMLSLAGLALRSRIARSGASRAAATDRIVARLGNMHGLPQKIGQILATRSSGRGQGQFQGLAAHRQSAIPLREAKAILGVYFGCSSDELFEEIDPEGVSGSVAQVHRATLVDGRKVAVKFQHWAIRDALRTDLAAIGWLTAPLGGLKRGLDLGAFREEIAHRLDEELDFKMEADAIRLFEGLYRGVDDVEVPTLIDELCREKVIVMSWLEGAALDVAADWPARIRKQLGDTLIRVFLEGIIANGVIQADPHPGNVLFRKEGKSGVPSVGIIDLGSLFRFSPEQRRAVVSLLLAHEAGCLDVEAAWTFHMGFGFRPDVLEPLRELLPEVLRAILTPWNMGDASEPTPWRPGDDIARILGPGRLAYRIAAPPSYLYLIRAWHGLVIQLRALDHHGNWRNLGMPLLAAQGIPVETTKNSFEGASGRALRVGIVRGNEEVVALRLPISAIDYLEDLVPEEYRHELSRLGFDESALREVPESIRYEPREIFRVSESDLTVRIWIEG